LYTEVHPDAAGARGGNQEIKRSFKKIAPLKLKAYVAQHPDAYQKEIAKEFGCAPSAVQKALKRWKITRKKDYTLPGAGTRQGCSLQI